MLPLRDIVVFPHMIVPLFVGREKSVRALEAVMKEDKQILLVAQKNAAQDEPGADDIFRIGTVSHDPATAEAAGRHGEGAGRGRPPGEDHAFTETEAYFEALPSRCRTRIPTSRSWRRSAAR